MFELLEEQVRMFFQTAVERQMILERRQAGLPRGHWTQDPVFRDRYFCNVFRCDDRVSAQILNLACRWQDPWHACLAGRLVNRSETLEQFAMLNRPATTEEFSEVTAGFGVNTNAYRINTPLGLNNLEGIWLMYQEGRHRGSHFLSQKDIPAALSTMADLRLGGFVGYQIVLDLIELQAFPAGFKDDWAWPGIGAERGARRAIGHKLSPDWKRRRNAPMIEITGIMHQLLERSLIHWPSHWRAWTIHEVEGWLCEYDKWARYTNGESAGGRKFKGPR